MTIAVTWRHRQSCFQYPLVFDDKVTIFRERIWGWYLHVAELCINGGGVHDGSKQVEPIPHSGYGVLSLTFSYFETLGKHIEGYQGNFESKKHFLIGVKKVFPQLSQHSPTDVDALLSKLYEGVRCGLYHTSQTTSGIFLSGELDVPVFAFNPSNKSLFINPHLIPPNFDNTFGHVLR